MRVRQKTLKRFKRRITEQIFEAVPEEIKTQNSPDRTLNWLIWRINLKICGLRGREICPQCRCARLGAPRSWMAFFRVVTDDYQLRELDKWIREKLYRTMYDKFGIRIQRSRLKRPSNTEGLKSLVNEKYQVCRIRIRPCLCDIRRQNENIWVFASDLYEGRSFKTLAQKRPFTVPFVDETGLQVSVGQRQYRVEKQVFQDLWTRLVKGGKILRADLEKAGMRNTSHIVALIAELPGIRVTYSPITLTLEEESPADFLRRQ